MEIPIPVAPLCQRGSRARSTNEESLGADGRLSCRRGQTPGTAVCDVCVNREMLGSGAPEVSRMIFELPALVGLG